MLLSNLFTLTGTQQVDILIEEDKIKSVDKHSGSLPEGIAFNEAIVFPGLINSHDHLDFNSFPQLGNRVYKNYVEWGNDIHQQNKTVIQGILKIPKQLRIQWGLYKNLLNGVTTVVNHGPKLQVGDEPITTWQACHTLHSIQLEKKWKAKLNFPFIKQQPFAIHVGEGTDDMAHSEIDALLKWNLFNRELIGIHGIAMDEEQAGKFKALVWCPDSNYFLIGRTAQIDKLKRKTKIVFGTDSTLSSNWNLWHQLRLAKEQKMLSDAELIDMLTLTPSEVWPMPNTGKLAKDHSADIVIARRSAEGMNAFCALNPEDILMVVHKGNIRLFDAELYPQLSKIGVDLQSFSKVNIGKSSKYIWGDLPKLMQAIKEYYPKAEFPVSY